MVKTVTAVTQTVWFGGSWEMNRDRPSGYHKACCFGISIGGNNAQISQICAITVQAISWLRTNELLTRKHTFLLHSFPASAPVFSPNLLPFTDFIIVPSIPHCPHAHRIWSSLEIPNYSVFSYAELWHCSQLKSFLAFFPGILPLVVWPSVWMKCSVTPLIGCQSTTLV